jgi:GTP-binding protein
VAKKTPLVISAVSGEGVKDVLRALLKVVEEARGGGVERKKPVAAAWQP